MPLTPQDFASKWKRADTCEHQSIQEHFIVTAPTQQTPLVHANGEVFIPRRFAK